MAQYQTTVEKWVCEDCGEVGYDIVPSHECPIKQCSDCMANYDTREDGNDEMCEDCVILNEGNDEKDN